MQSLSPDLRPRISARARLQKDPVSGKPVLLYPEGVLILNNTGHAIISLCDGTASIEQIASTLARRFQNASVPQMVSDIINYLDSLRARNLVELVESPKSS
jgi:pyrroloquinoline quinone biosynthesis protein D